jgi:hypothetical protein
MLDEELKEYLFGNNNAAVATVVLLREPTSDGVEHITIKTADGEYTIYDFWRNPNKAGKGNKGPPKHTGGKSPYIKLMTEEIRRLHKEGLQGREESLGTLLYLSDNVEWGTGRLVNKRSKKPLCRGDLIKMLGYGDQKLSRIVKSLKEHGLLTHTSEGYFISPRLMRKGGKTKQEGD